MLAVLLFCLQPVGAIPDDGVSDRAAIQAALDALPASGGTVCLGPGRWTVERGSPHNRVAALSLRGRDVALVGAGPSTVIELVGDQGAGAVSVVSVEPRAVGVRVADLAIDTSAATNTEEQTHAIHVSGSDVTIERVMLRHPRRAGERKGDCVRLLGNTPATAVRGVRIVGVSFDGCARSGVGIQRNVHELLVHGCRFRGSGDQDIDSEPTGGAGDLNADITITGNVFSDPGRTSQGDWAVTLGGVGAPMARIVVDGNIFNGRGIGLYRTAQVAITDNVIAADMRGAGGVISSGNVLAHAVIAGNVIARSGVAGPVVRITPQSGGRAESVQIVGNDITQHTAGSGIYLESVDGATASANALTWATGAPAEPAVYVRATSDVGATMLVANRIRAPDLGWGVFAAAAPGSIDALTVANNAVRGARVPIACSQTAPGVMGRVASDLPGCAP